MFERLNAQDPVGSGLGECTVPAIQLSFLRCGVNQHPMDGVVCVNQEEDEVLVKDVLGDLRGPAILLLE